MLRTGLILEEVPLATLTTLEVGGPARYLARPESCDEARQVLALAERLGLPCYPLGDGSNLLASDEGFDGILLQPVNRELRLDRSAAEVRVLAGAGLEWDELVQRTVQEGLAGLECLSGIPGRVGACPIQNVGAYGQEVAETLHAVHVLDRQTGQACTVPREACGFSYRDSLFKGTWKGRYLVTAVEFLLLTGRQASLRYGDLTRFFGLGPGEPPPPLDRVRQGVLEVRRSKSMVRDPGNPNSRSAGSFFTNPLVPRARALELQAAWPEMPAHRAGSGLARLSAAWLIERAGFPKGYSRGRAGLSTDHVLALVNRGGATAAEILGLAAEIRREVRALFGVLLVPEPNLLGFRRTLEELLAES